MGPLITAEHRAKVTGYIDSGVAEGAQLVVDGRALRVRGNPAHPPTAGVLCTKVSRYAERTHHADRILTPLRRVGAKGQGRFEPIGWDAALDEVATRLQAIAARQPSTASAAAAP